MLVQIASAAQEAVKTVQEPVLTWNLFVTGFGLPFGLILLGKYIESKIKSKAKADADLEAEKHKALVTWQTHMEQTITSWQEGAKERTMGICKKLDEIRSELAGKRDEHICEKIHADIDKKHDRIEEKVNHIAEKVFYT